MSRIKWLVVFLGCLIPTIGKTQINGIKIIGDPCTDITLAIQVTGTSSSPYFFWNFGDATSGTNDTVTITGISPSPNPVHTFSAPGIYQVCASFQEPGQQPDSVCRTFSILLCCDGVVSSADSCLQGNTAFQLLTDAAVSATTWDFGDAASGTSNTATGANPFHQFSAAGSFVVTATVNAQCGSFTVTHPVTIIDCATPLCISAISYSASCVDSSVRFLINTTASVNSVSWTFGDTASGLANNAVGSPALHRFTSPGVYYISATVSLDCGTQIIEDTITIADCPDELPIDTICSSTLFPNAFSPNGDGVNDVFRGFSNCPVINYTISIYNRWGELVYIADSINAGWDGFYKGDKQPAGVYIAYASYIVGGNSKKFYTGSLTLIR